MTNFKTAVRSAWDAAWNHGQIEALDEIVHPDYALENTGLGQTSGLAELKAQIRDMRAAMPDLKTTVDMIVVEGDAFARFLVGDGNLRQCLRRRPPERAQAPDPWRCPGGTVRRSDYPRAGHLGPRRRNALRPGNPGARIGIRIRGGVARN